MYRFPSYSKAPKVILELKDIPKWPAYYVDMKAGKKDVGYEPAPAALVEKYKHITAKPAINDKMCIWRGDITSLKIDAIVNAANDGLWAGGGICGAIHNAAGYELERECDAKYPRGCDTGDTVITGAYNLPCKHVLHSVGPTNGSAAHLESCYKTCLELMLKNNLRSVAFCCIATGIFSFPNDKAAEIALRTCREWLETGDNASKVDALIFCVFLPRDLDLYHSYAPVFFPVPEGTATAAAATATGAAAAAVDAKSATATPATATAAAAASTATAAAGSNTAAATSTSSSTAAAAAPADTKANDAANVKK